MEPSLFAQEAARPDEQHERHHHVDHGLGRGGEIDRGEPRGDADHQAANQCAKQTAEAADDNRDEARHDEVRADGQSPSRPAASTPARPAI